MQSQDACCFCISSVLLEFLTWVQTGSWRYCSCRGRPCSWGLKPANFCESVPCTRHELQGHRDLTWACSRTVLDLDECPRPVLLRHPKGRPFHARQYYWNPRPGGCRILQSGSQTTVGLSVTWRHYSLNHFWTMKRSR